MIVLSVLTKLSRLARCRITSFSSLGTAAPSSPSPRMMAVAAGLASSVAVYRPRIAGPHWSGGRVSTILESCTVKTEMARSRSMRARRSLATSFSITLWRCWPCARSLSFRRWISICSRCLASMSVMSSSCSSSRACMGASISCILAIFWSRTSAYTSLSRQRLSSSLYARSFSMMTSSRWSRVLFSPSRSRVRSSCWPRRSLSLASAASMAARMASVSDSLLVTRPR
mmetsp:Transcript_44461/g.141544  ORF Transcript_44461/g.141544 Transcript_44461/m.141544 type:complete len:228 (-) Transcript_44461:3238-3921(-)